MTFGSLFTGIGAFDLGLSRAGMRCLWQVEIERSLHPILERHFPGIQRHGDIRFLDPRRLARVDVLCGGDPCPSRSLSRFIHGTVQPDLWPEFLRFVRELRPLWVLREHVVSGDVDDCARELLREGYGPVVVEMDGAAITGQSRRREFLCGVLADSGLCPLLVLSEPAGPDRNPAPVCEEEAVAACLTTHPQRFDTRDNYVLEPGSGTRILDVVERERLLGLDDNWTAGLANRPRARALGNALIVQKAEWLGRRIVASQEGLP